MSRDPRSGVTRRQHLDEATINKSIKAEVARVGIAKRASSLTLGDHPPTAREGTISGRLEAQVIHSQTFRLIFYSLKT